MGLKSELRPLAENLFSQLQRAAFDGVGITRDSFGPGECRAHDLVASVALEEGLLVERDRAGNLVISLPGRDESRPFIGTGSHLDSVPRGGNFDGAAGVVAGLLAMTTLKRGGIVPARTIKLFAFRGEESAWFGKSWIGSHALFGLLSETDLRLARADTGRTLRSYFEEIGADATAIAAGERLLDPEAMCGFIEVHIEQGPVLASQAVPLGVVTSIYGNLRHRRVTCHGVAAHAGTTPRSLRRDAVVSTADWIVRMDTQWAHWLSQGRQLTITHGIVHTDAKEEAISRVAAEVNGSLEIRAEDIDTLMAFHDAAKGESLAVQRERGVTFNFDDPIINPPASMDPEWMSSLEQLCVQGGVRYLRLASGAGHDAAVFANVGIPTAMLFVRNTGGSHNPGESMDVSDLLIAAEILERALLLSGTKGRR